MVVEIDALARIADGSTVLDVGSGFGGTLEALDAVHHDAHLIGLDVDGRQLALCRRLEARPSNRLSWVQADGCALPIATASVDHVLSIEAMWHFSSRATFLAEVGRVLRPGGTAAVVDLLVDHGAAQAVGLSESELVERLDAGFAPWPDLHATEEELCSAAAGVGLRCTEVIDATASTKPTYLDHGDAGLRPGAASFSASPAVALFVQLHQADLLRVVYLAFERPSHG